MKNGDKPMFPDPLRGAEQSFLNQDPGANPEGITKREYFAAMAMQGLLANPEWMKEFEGKKYLFHGDILAKLSIERADALLKELEQ